jgi:hypothetical protein
VNETAIRTASDIGQDNAICMFIIFYKRFFIMVNNPSIFRLKKGIIEHLIYRHATEFSDF